MKTLVVLTGPTGVGKTSLSLQLAQRLGSPVFSCDSRQMYRELSIGTAAPTPEQLSIVPHVFVGQLSIHDYYSAARFEEDALRAFQQHFEQSDVALMTGGSMLYIDAVCKGIDDMPDVDSQLRAELLQRYEQHGLDDLLAELRLLDPDYYQEVDRKNPKRVLHGLEICLTTGQPFSHFRRKTAKQRPFKVIKICLNRDRQDLYQRIDARVLNMMNQGLEAEARNMFPYRHLNALHTVGYRELFDYFDGLCSKEEAVSRIQFNTHKYARKQLTWFRRDPDYHWFHPDDTKGILQCCEALA